MNSVVSTAGEGPLDVLIVGGGPAGLTCALFLARSRRRVLVIDAGRPRNYAARAIHGFLGQHGIAPSRLLERGRHEAREAGAQFLDATVDRAWREGELFAVAAAGQTLRCRRLVLAYGLRDVLPELPGLHDFYGRSIFHCPDCDGFEICDRRVGVIGWTRQAVGLALELLQWTRHITVLTHRGQREWQDDYPARLGEWHIGIRHERLLRLVGHDGQLERVEFDEGPPLELDALFFTLGMEQTCGLGIGLQCECADARPYIKVDERKQTSIPGVYAIGDIVPGSQLAVTAAADGAIAAIAINKSLLDPRCQL